MSVWPGIPGYRDPLQVDNSEIVSVAARKIREFGRTWVDYTPAWTGSVASPSIGNGTLVGRYVRAGTVVFVRLFWEAGSTTTFGSGYYYFSLPTEATVNPLPGTSFDPAIGGGLLHDDGTRDYLVTPVVVIATSTVAVYVEATATTSTVAWQHDSPFTVAQDDTLKLGFVYEGFL